MYYGYECKNPANNWQGSAGCWGVLAFGSKAPEVEVINFCMSDSFTTGSLADCLAKEFEAADKTLKGQEARGKAMHELCETILRNRVQWKLEYREDNRGSLRWWLRVEGISKMPKNHVMFMLFSLRSSLSGSHKHTWKALRDRGIKSNRKMILGCQLILEFSGMQGLGYIQGIGPGGRIFLSEQTVVADVVTMYRGTKLKGPADEPWSVGGGYSSGETGRTVQYAGCSSMVVSDKRRGARGHQLMTAGTAKGNMFATLGMSSGSNYEVEKVFNKLADFLKTLK